jgi:arabinan endo-1,5-alpha-L-arabinosidase
MVSAFIKAAWLCAVAGLVSLVCACGSSTGAPTASASTTQNLTSSSDPLTNYVLTGNTQPVHDPSIIRQGNTYYAFTSDMLALVPGNYLPIRCSQDKVNWTSCGSVFPKQMPSWITAKVPGALCLWAPDVSYFGGLYHVYYAASTAGSQLSVIGLATNPTLDPADPDYLWADQGEVLSSAPGDDFNAIDPNILVDTDGGIWLTYGSYWNGIKQRRINPVTGKLSTTDATRYDLAARPVIPNDPIEGASLIQHNGYYYLFVSIDYCCNPILQADNYKEAVGRSSSPHGPFTDEQGIPMMQGGGTVLLKGNSAWIAPGGRTVYLDTTNNDTLIAFHALKVSENGTPYLWVKNISWQNDWPVIEL